MRAEPKNHPRCGIYPGRRLRSAPAWGEHDPRSFLRRHLKDRARVRATPDAVRSEAPDLQRELAYRIAHGCSAKRRAYIAADAIMALAIVAILLGVLTTAVSRQRRGGERLADSREAIRLAEDTITALQTGSEPPPAPDGMTVTVRPTTWKHELQPPSGSAWVDVQVTFGKGRTSSLAGLVRADAAKEVRP